RWMRCHAPLASGCGDAAGPLEADAAATGPSPARPRAEGRSAGSAEPGRLGPGHCLGARGDADLAVHGTDLRLDGVARDEQLGGELLEGPVLGEPGQDDLLAA